MRASNFSKMACLPLSLVLTLSSSVAFGSDLESDGLSDTVGVSSSFQLGDVKKRVVLNLDKTWTKVFSYDKRYGIEKNLWVEHDIDSEGRYLDIDLVRPDESGMPREVDAYNVPSMSDVFRLNGDEEGTFAVYVRAGEHYGRYKPGKYSVTFRVTDGVE